MERISLQECLLSTIPHYEKMSDAELRDAYKICCEQLNSELENFVKERIIELRSVKKADKKQVPSERRTLIDSLVNMYARIFLGRAYTIQQKEGDAAIKLYIATGV